MADIAFNPGLGGASLGRVDSPAPTSTSTANQRVASAGIPVSGSLAPPTPGTKPEPFSKQELVSRDSAKNKFTLNDADANRWAYLERMSVNVGTTRPTDGGQLKYHVDALQNKLSEHSTMVKAYGDHIKRLEANPWSKVPFSDHNRELSWAHRMLTQSTKSLESMRAEVDQFLSRPKNLPYYRNAIDQPRQ
jgi:hypothetical protein